VEWNEKVSRFSSDRDATILEMSDKAHFSGIITTFTISWFVVQPQLLNLFARTVSISVVAVHVQIPTDSGVLSA
jgi:hypothetical protein